MLILTTSVPSGSPMTSRRPLRCALLCLMRGVRPSDFSASAGRAELPAVAPPGAVLVAPAEDGASTDAVPIPDNWTLCGLPGASLATLRFALLPPVADGEKATPTVQELLGATAWPSQVLEAETIEKSAASAPATVTVLTF